jgi:hypothetical protein
VLERSFKFLQWVSRADEVVQLKASRLQSRDGLIERAAARTQKCDFVNHNRSQ